MLALARFIFLYLLLDTKQTVLTTTVESASQDSVSQLLSKIRGSWGPPVPYLEKRGYMDQRQLTTFANQYLNKEELVRELQKPAVYTERTNPTFYPPQTTCDEDRSANQNFRDERIQLGDYLSDPYIGEGLFNKIKQKWNNLWNKTATTLPPTKPAATTAPTTIVSTKLGTTPKPVVGNNPWFTSLGMFKKLQPPYVSNDLGRYEQPGMLLNEPDILEKPPPRTEINENYIMPNITSSDIDYMRKYVNCNNKTDIHNLTSTANSKKYLDEKLKFLANIHHSVKEVGIVKPEHRLDMKAVQDQIDEARMTYNLNEAVSMKGKNNSKENSQNFTLPGSLWWPLGARLSKRSVLTDHENRYYNDYLDSSDKNMSEYAYDQDEQDYEDEAPPHKSHLDKESANLFGWFRHKKHKKHKHKHHKYRFWKKHHSDFTDKEKLHDKGLIAIRSKQINEFSDLSDIQDRIHPEQQQDIVKFIRNVNAQPQKFDFNVDAFVANYRSTENESTIFPPTELVTEKTFYEFAPETAGSDSNASEFEIKRIRRDILTQHLKAIARKVHLYPSSNDGLLDWSNSVVNNEVDMIGNIQQSEGNTGDEEDNQILDNFYLLNDGKPLPDALPNKSAALSQLNMDLELDRKFRDLNTAKDASYYATEEEREANARKSI